MCTPLLLVGSIEMNAAELKKNNKITDCTEYNRLIWYVCWHCDRGNQQSLAWCEMRPSLSSLIGSSHYSIGIRSWQQSERIVLVRTWADHSVRCKKYALWVIALKLTKTLSSIGDMEYSRLLGQAQHTSLTASVSFNRYSNESRWVTVYQYLSHQLTNPNISDFEHDADIQPLSTPHKA